MSCSSVRAEPSEGFIWEMPNLGTSAIMRSEILLNCSAPNHFRHVQKYGAHRIRHEFSDDDTLGWRQVNGRGPAKVLGHFRTSMPYLELDGKLVMEGRCAPPSPMSLPGNSTTGLSLCKRANRAEVYRYHLSHLSRRAMRNCEAETAFAPCCEAALQAPHRITARGFSRMD